MIKPLPLSHRVWTWVAVTTLVLLILSRNLYYATTALPPSIDVVLQRVLVTQTLSTLVGLQVDVVLFWAAVWVGVPLLLFRRHWVFQREGELWGVRAWLHSLAWLVILMNHAIYEVNFYVASVCLLSLPMIVLSRQRAGAMAGVVSAVGWLLFVALAPDDADRVAVLAWGVVVASLVWVAPRFLASLDRFTLAMLLIPIFQVSPGYLTMVLRMHDGMLVGEGMAYAYCESAARGKIFAMVPHCGTSWPKVEDCRNAVVEVIDVKNPLLVERYRILDGEYYGRIEEPVCLEHTVQVGMNRTVYRGERLVESALEFDIDEPTRVRAHVLGEAGGHRILYDARDDVLYYVGDDVLRVHRYDRKADQMKRWEDSGPAAARIVSAAIHPGRRSLFAVAADSPVRELRLDDMSLVQSYPNGAGTEITVDPDRNRFVVTGFFGLEVYDLDEGRPILRRRTGALARRPTLDPVNGVAVVSIFGSGKLEVLDLQSFEPIGQIPIGIGARYPHVSLDGRFLFAGSQRAHFVWRLPELLGEMREE